MWGAEALTVQRNKAIEESILNRKSVSGPAAAAHRNRFFVNSIITRDILGTAERMCHTTCGNLCTVLIFEDPRSILGVRIHLIK